MKLFDLDGPFQHYGGLVFDLLALNLIWLFLTIFSLGLLAGPAMVSLYDSVYHAIVTGQAYPFRTFFSSLKKRFFFQLAFALFYFIIMILSLFNIYITLTGQFGFLWLLPLYFFIFIELCLFGTIALPLLAQNRSLKLGHLVKISFILANKHLPWVFLATLPNLLLVFVFFITFMGYVQYSFPLFFLPGLSALASGYWVSKQVLAQYNFFDGFDGNFGA